jgi:hypothetical protein
VLGNKFVSKLMCDFNAFAMCEGASEAVEVFLLRARELAPKRPLIRLKIPTFSLHAFCPCVKRRFSRSMAGIWLPFVSSSRICGCELKQTERRMGFSMCSVLGQEARGMTGGKTDNNNSGKVPLMLGRGVLPPLTSTDDSSMTISGCVHVKFNQNLITKAAAAVLFTLMYGGNIETCDEDVDDERFSSSFSSFAISASNVAISLR